MKKLQMVALAGPLVCLVPAAGFAQVAVLTDPEYLAGAPAPITAHETVWMQEMTWPEIRDAIQLYGKNNGDHCNRRCGAERSVFRDGQA